MKTEEIAAESEKTPRKTEENAVWIKAEQKKNEKTPFSQRESETKKGNLYREKTECTEKTRNGQRKRPLTVRMLSETVLFSAKKERRYCCRGKRYVSPFIKVGRKDRS